MTGLAVQIRRKAYGAHEVLRDIAFSVEPGETLVVLGPSGVGKSTLLRIVAGLDPAFEGEVLRPERLAVVFQEPTLLPWRSVLNNLTLVTGAENAAAERVLASVGLTGKGRLFPRQLSLGQQRRLALARAFVARPELLLLDEPFTSLDLSLVEDMLVLTERMIAETQPATLFVTHSVTEASRLSTRVLRLTAPPRD